MGVFTQQIPDEAHKRRILVLVDRGRARAYKNKDWFAGLKLDDAIAVILLDDSEPLHHPVMKKLEQNGLTARNHVLALNPFHGDEYKTPEQQVFGLPIEKARIMRYLAQLLGATQFSLEVEHKDARALAWKAGLEGSGPKGGGGAMVHRAVSALANASATISGKFQGAEPDLKKAEHLLTRAGLFADSEFRALYEAALPGNRVLEHKCSVEAVSEATKLIELAAHAKVSGVFECKGDFKLDKSEKTEYRMKICVSWARR